VILDGSTVGPGALIRSSIISSQVTIGEGTHIDGGVVLGEGVRVGADNVLAHGARVFPGVELPDAAIKF
jgi:mannose-1-phosphate guanylyltransferase